MHGKVSLSTCVALCTFLLASVASAQDFRLNHFRAAERPDDGFGVRRLRELGHLRFGALVTGDYANDPLVIEARGGSNAQYRTIVKHELALKIDLSLSLWDRVLVIAGVEAVPLLKGPSVPVGFPVPRADGAGMGDLSVGARVRLLGEADDFFALGAQATLIAPTAGTQHYRGEGSVAARPELIAELRPKPVRITANVGFLVRENERLLDARIGDELIYAVGVGIPVIERLELMGELWGGYMLKGKAARQATPFEWLAGAKYHSKHELYVAAAAGTGFTHGIGSPDARVVVQLGYLMPKKQKPADGDRDHDGILDSVDACPDAPEDRDGFEDQDGCPDLDDDKDGIPDSADACPHDPEDADGFADEDGCPDPDNDNDGILDRDDACPSEPGVPEQRGCPAKVEVTEESDLQQLDQIHFENNKAVILPESMPNMEAVQALMERHPEIRRVQIEGHTDSVGQDQKNLTLSRARASSVAAWLVTHGVDKARLTAYGCGEKHPIAPNETPEGRAANRRVVFQVEGPTTEGLKPPAGCVSTPVE